MTDAKERPICERDIEKYLVRRVRECFGKAALCRKVTWQGRRSAPDRVVMFRAPADAIETRGFTVWVELKRPGEKPTRAQSAEHMRLAEAGQLVRVLDSKEAVDDFLRHLYYAAPPHYRIKSVLP